MDKLLMLVKSINNALNERQEYVKNIKITWNIYTHKPEVNIEFFDPNIIIPITPEE